MKPRSPHTRSAAQILRTLFLGSLTACAGGVTDAAIDQEIEADVGATSTADSLLAFMMKGGCTRSTGSRPGLTIALRDGDGREARFFCDGIGIDSMFSLGSQFQSRTRSVDSDRATMMDNGYYDYETRYREYCLVNSATWEVLYCGIYFPYQVQIWVPGPYGDGPPEGDSCCGGPGSSPADEGDHPPNEVPKECNQAVNPNCHQPLTVEDNLKLNQSYQYLRDTTGVWADTVAQRECKELFAGLELLRSRPAPWGVFRGIDSLAVGTEPVHDSQGYQGNGRFHFDPQTLNAATTPNGLKLLLSAGLHETAHALSKADHGESTNYADFDYFKYTNIAGKNSCVLP